MDLGGRSTHPSTTRLTMATPSFRSCRGNNPQCFRMPQLVSSITAMLACIQLALPTTKILARVWVLRTLQVGAESSQVEEARPVSAAEWGFTITGLRKSKLCSSLARHLLASLRAVLEIPPLPILLQTFRTAQRSLNPSRI